jgi:heterodisulfide reductase subunit C
MPTLRKIVLNATGQDVFRCQNCALCENGLFKHNEEQPDLLPYSLLQMVVYNDEEVLSSRSVWSDQFLPIFRTACHRGLNIETIILALREEARKRGLNGNNE